MNRSDDYTYSNLLTERQAAIEAEYKREISKFAKWALAAYLVFAGVILLYEPVAFFLAKL